VLAPLSVKDPDPCLVRANAPPTAPLITSELEAVNVVTPVNVPTPLNVSVPLLVASPNVTAPDNDTLFVNERAVVESLDTDPPDIANAPLPNA
jgi:hypothetical protein